LPGSTDIDGDAVSYAINTQAANGTAVVNAGGTFTYNPNANFNGSDSFSYTISDGQGGTNTYTVTVSAAPVNDAPTTSVVTLSPIAEDSGPRLITQSELLANAADVDSASLTATGLIIASGAGSLVDNGNGTWTYTPALHDDTAVSFSYTVSDGSLTAPGSASLDITPVNNAPMSSAYGFSTWEDTVFSGTLPAASDVEGDTITYGLTTPASHGTVSIATDGSFAYTPVADYFGSDSFAFTVSDGNGGSNTYAVSIDITPVNDAPSGTDGTVSVNEDSTYLFQPGDFGFSDSHDSPADNLLNVLITTLPTAGTLEYQGTPVTAGQAIAATDIVNGKLRFVPVADANGTGYASFTFQDQDSGGIIDGGVDIDPVARTLTINVTPVNDAPIASNDSASGNEDTAITGSVLANDSDIDSPTLTATLASGPANGSLILNADGSFSYTPFANWNGTDSFTYTANDGALTSNVATVTLTVNPVNDVPAASGTTIAVNGNTTYTGSLPAAVDADGDAVSYSLAAQGANGTATVNPDGTFNYTPNAGFSGSDSFVFAINDGNGGSNVYTVAVNVAAVIEAAAPLLPTDPAPPPQTAPDEQQPAAEETPAKPDQTLLAEITHLTIDKAVNANQPGEESSSPSPAYSSGSSSPTFTVSVDVDSTNHETKPPVTLLDSLNAALRSISNDAQAMQLLQNSLGNSSFQQQLNQLQDEIRQQLSLDKNTVASSLAVSTGLSVGYVLWLVRGGVLLSSLLSSLPAWRLIDPLPILGHLKRQKNGDEDDDSLESMLKKSAAKPKPTHHMDGHAS
jgi:VCBS repeat-containing protein